MGVGEFALPYIAFIFVLTVIVYFCRYIHKTKLLGNTICFIGLVIVVSVILGHTMFGFEPMLKIQRTDFLLIFPAIYIVSTLGVFYYSFREFKLSRKPPM